MKLIGLGFLLSGAGMVVSGILTLRESISPFLVPVECAELKTDGPFKVARHPVYGGTILYFAGYSLVSNSLDRAILTFILSIVMNHSASLEEVWPILAYLIMSYVMPRRPSLVCT